MLIGFELNFAEIDLHNAGCSQTDLTEDLVNVFFARVVAAARKDECKRPFPWWSDVTRDPGIGNLDHCATGVDREGPIRISEVRIRIDSLTELRKAPLVQVPAPAAVDSSKYSVVSHYYYL